MINFDVNTFFSTRELENCPPHFLKANTPINKESLIWVRNKLKGRYSLVQISNTDLNNFIFSQVLNIYFEDPREATIYELRWSGTK
jgi:hypothetical protein